MNQVDEFNRQVVLVKVLIASSEATVRHMASTALSAAGYAVRCVDNGQDAWEEIDLQTGPLIAVLDWQMPDHDGIKISRQLRNSKFRNYVYVLLLTKRKSKLDELVALEAGIDDYLHHPFIPDELVARVNIGKRLLDHENKLNNIINEFRAMVDNSPFPMVCLDAKGIIRRMNKTFSNISGNGTSYRLIGHSIAEVLSIHPIELNTLIRKIQEASPIDHMPIKPLWKNVGNTETYINGQPVTGLDTATYLITFINQREVDKNALNGHAKAVA